MKQDYVIVYIEEERPYARYVYKNLVDSEFCNKEDAEKKADDPSEIFGYYYENEIGKVSVW